MDEAARESEARFAAYMESLAGVLGHADRAEPLKDYCTGLLMPVERKSVEPMAAMVSPARAAAAHQSLLHFVGQSAWSDEAMLGKVRDSSAPAFAAQGGVEALDRRRHGISEEGLAFGGRGAPILRAAGQDGQLPDRGDALDRQSSYEPADRLSALSAGKLGERRGAPRKGACSRGREVRRPSRRSRCLRSRPR